MLPTALQETSWMCESLVSVWCPNCSEAYQPQISDILSRIPRVQARFFGTTFAHLLLMVYPELNPVELNKYNNNNNNNKIKPHAKGSVGEDEEKLSSIKCTAQLWQQTDADTVVKCRCLDPNCHCKQQAEIKEDADGNQHL